MVEVMRPFSLPGLLENPHYLVRVLRFSRCAAYTRQRRAPALPGTGVHLPKILKVRLQ